MLNNFFSLSSWPWSRNGEESRLGFSGLVPLWTFWPCSCLLFAFLGQTLPVCCVVCGVLDAPRYAFNLLTAMLDPITSSLTERALARLAMQPPTLFGFISLSSRTLQCKFRFRRPSTRGEGKGKNTDCLSLALIPVRWRLVDSLVGNLSLGLAKTLNSTLETDQNLILGCVQGALCYICYSIKHTQCSHVDLTILALTVWTLPTP